MTRLDPVAALAALATDVSVIALSLGAFLFWGEPWWAGLLLGWFSGALAGAGVWALVRTVHRGSATDRRPGLEDGGVLADLGGVVHHERAVTQHTRRLR